MSTQQSSRPENVASSSDEKPEQDLEPVEFKTLDARDKRIEEIPSLCMNCRKEGLTRLLLVNIPHFREVIVSGFTCPHCGYQDNKVDSAAKIQPQGIHFIMKLEPTKECMDRTVVRSGTCTLKLPEVGLEDPNKSGTAVITTVEGILTDVARNMANLLLMEGLSEPQRKAIESIRDRLTKYTERQPTDEPLTLDLDDPSGNSFLADCKGENVKRYYRTPEQSMQVGVDPQQDEQLRRSGMEIDDKDGERIVERLSEVTTADSIYTMPTACPSCLTEGTTQSAVLHVPYFKELILMSFVCPNCHFKTVEVKPASGIGEKGIRVSLRVTDPEDLKRDVLKSMDATVKLEELQVSAEGGTLGGVLTSLEGLLLKIKEQMGIASAHVLGDSVEPAVKERMQRIIDTIDGYSKGIGMPFTITIDDPTSNSFIQNLYAPDPDPEMTVTEYTRTKEQDDELGLLDMKTENY